MKHDIVNFVQVVPTLDYQAVDADMWENLCCEGPPEEYEVEERSKWLNEARRRKLEEEGGILSLKK